MKAMVMRDSWGIENIVLEDRAEPEPGPGEVKLRMLAASLNYRDFVITQRGYGRRSGELPLVPVSDGAGEVVAVGDDVSRVAIGDLVCPIFGQTWLHGSFRDQVWVDLLGGPLDGVMQEYMVLSQEGVVKVPPHLEAVEAATLPCAAVTAWNAVVTQGQTKAGDVVVVQGTGGVSLFALIFAKMHGARVIATSSDDEKLARVQELGADHLINYKTTPDWRKEVRAYTNGIGADLIVEVGGAGTLASSIGSIRSSGTIALIGVLSGGAGEINLGPVVTQNVRLQGVTVGSRDIFEDILQAMSLHETRPPIDDNLFAFEDVGDAIASLVKGTHYGKVCTRF